MKPSRHSRCSLLPALLGLVFLLPLLPLPVASAALLDKQVTLTVVKGDTLSEISYRYLEETSLWRELARINKLENPHLIFPGQKLAIPTSFLKGTPLEGAVTFVKGEARVQERKGGEWRLLQMHDRVPEGSGVKTGAASALEITFEDGSTIFQEAETTLELSASRQGPLHLLRELFLLGGRTINRIKGATGREQRAVIRTPAALSAMRGTEVRVSSDAAETTRTEVMAGVVEVEALGWQVVVRENEGTAVKKGQPPIAPRELLPPPQVISQPPFSKFPVEIAFSRIAGAAAYRVLLSRDSEGKDIVREEIIHPDAFLSVRDLADGVYCLWAMSIDDAGIMGFAGEPTPLPVRINPLPPLLQSPATDRSQTVRLKWLQVKDAARYHLQIAADREFTRILAETVQKDSDYTMKELAPGQYFFRVSSIAADGYEGAWSDIQGFTILSPPPAPTVEKPSPQEQAIQVRWSDLGPDYTYHVQVARDLEFSEVILDRQAAGPDIVFARPEKAGTYFVRTSAIDGKGYEGDFSPPQALQIERSFPFGVLLLVPLGVIALLAL